MYATEISIVGLVLCVVGTLILLTLSAREERIQKEKLKRRKAEREYYEWLHSDPNWIGE